MITTQSGPIFSSLQLWSQKSAENMFAEKCCDNGRNRNPRPDFKSLQKSECADFIPAKVSKSLQLMDYKLHKKGRSTTRQAEGA